MFGGVMVLPQLLLQAATVNPKPGFGNCTDKYTLSSSGIANPESNRNIQSANQYNNLECPDAVKLWETYDCITQYTGHS